MRTVKSDKNELVYSATPSREEWGAVGERKKKSRREYHTTQGFGVGT